MTRKPQQRTWEQYEKQLNAWLDGKASIQDVRRADPLSDASQRIAVAAARRYREQAAAGGAKRK